MFSYFEIERETKRERTSEQGSSREKRRERIPSRLYAMSSEHTMGLHPMILEIIT